jgi:hypothetical protein
MLERLCNSCAVRVAGTELWPAGLAHGKLFPWYLVFFNHKVNLHLRHKRLAA